MHIVSFESGIMQQSPMSTFDAQVKSPGLASLAFVINFLNAMDHLRVGAGKLDENDILHADKNDLSKVLAGWKTEDLSMGQLYHVAMLLGFGTHSHYAMSPLTRANQKFDRKALKSKVKAYESSIFDDVSSFRDYASSGLKKPVTGLLVNFECAVGGRTWAPLEKYDDVKDAFYLAGEKPKEGIWLKCEELYKSMTSLDLNTGLPGGVLRINVLI